MGQILRSGVSETKKAVTTFRQQSDYSNYLNLKRVEAMTKRTLNTARRNSFRAFCDNLDRTTPHSRVWRTIKIFKNRFTQPAIASCSADREVIAHLNSLIEEICPPTVFNDQFPTNFRDNPFLQAPFSELSSPADASVEPGSVFRTKINETLIIAKSTKYLEYLFTYNATIVTYNLMCVCAVFTVRVCMYECVRV